MELSRQIFNFFTKLIVEAGARPFNGKISVAEPKFNFSSRFFYYFVYFATSNKLKLKWSVFLKSSYWRRKNCNKNCKRRYCQWLTMVDTVNDSQKSKEVETAENVFFSNINISAPLHNFSSLSASCETLGQMTFLNNSGISS